LIPVNLKKKEPNNCYLSISNPTFNREKGVFLFKIPHLNSNGCKIKRRRLESFILKGFGCIGAWCDAFTLKA